MSPIYRSHSAGLLATSHVGQTVTLSGFVHAIRRQRRITFVELREQSGIVQVVCTPEQSAELTVESCWRVVGEVALRSSPHPNLASYPTGLIEVRAQEVTLMNRSGPLPFASHEAPGEMQMLAHRPLALRWPEHQRPIILRAQAVAAMRAVVERAGCIEVETPVLVAKTPGGAAPFEVPVPERGGYALAQSPQLWKQLLVCGGIERYYQLAHCFRNEGSRPERQPEFSQFEIECAFATEEEIRGIMEECVLAAAQAVGAAMTAPVPVLTYEQALARHGTENPHLGNPLRLVTTPTSSRASKVHMVLPHVPTPEEAERWLSGVQHAVGFHARAVWEAPEKLSLTGPTKMCQEAMGSMLRQIGETWQLITPGCHAVWVTERPVFEMSSEGKLESAHHPFTRPLPGHEHQLAEAPLSMLGAAFDLIINGWEIGGGSMRIHEAPLQRAVFAALGYTEAEEEFSSLLQALERGAPPHGGMALGVERLVSVLLGLPHIRSVMAFPKTSGGQCLLTRPLHA